jgi:hypothetical protein
MKLAAFLLLPRLLTTEPPAGAVKLNPPRVQMRNNEASATRSPWVDSNGWRIMRTPNQQFYYQVTGDAAMLAAAESFTYGSDALISADAAGAQAFEKMMTFLRTIPEAKDLQPVADFGVIDDGSDQTGEVLNLLTRQNLLFKIEKAADKQFSVNVRIGSKDYPAKEASNPSFIAHKIRSQLGDDNRSIRLYGSDVVVSHYVAKGDRARVYLVNYSNRPVRGLRVRVRGDFAKGEARLYNIADAHLEDWVQDSGTTEFSIPELGAFAVIDLSR